MPKTRIRLKHTAAALAGVIVLASFLLPLPLHAQYFGRNKVQYDKFDFRILPTEHFKIHFYPAESLATADAARMAERWYVRHRELLKHEFTDNPLIFYADHPDFQQSNVIEGMINQGTGGVTEGLRERVIMPFTGNYADFDHVLGHELVHVFQYRIAEATNRGFANLSTIPLWLIEGMAEYLSLGRNDPNTAMWLRDAVRRNDLPTLTQLTRDPRYFPYRYGQAFWAFIGGTWGDEEVNNVFRSALAHGWERGLENALGMDSDSLSTLWHVQIRAAYANDMNGRVAPDGVGTAIALAGGRGEQNISPAVSPDGRYVAYFSSRGLFGIDLYLADATTGEVISQLTSVTTNPHFDALSFISSAGTWSPDGTRLAFVVFADGDNEINVMNVASRRVERRIRIDGVTAITDPAWSPDGAQLAFTGFKGGISDLYVHNLNTNATRQVTNDREAQFQPTWSPDGRTIAFVTDAGEETSFATMSFGPMRLALWDVGSSEVRLLQRFGGGKHINPQFSRDGSALYFVSDQDGVSDIYRLTLASGEVQRLTHVATGISGITSMSPAISVARNTGTVMFSVFDQQGYSIRSLSEDQLTGQPAVVATAPVAGILPPASPSNSIVSNNLADPDVGLPAASPVQTTPYNASLKLDFIGGPQIGVAFGGGYGTGLAGGIAFGFSDQLGNNILQTVVQAQGELKDLGGQALYLNRGQRWNWGAQAYHIPIAGAFATYSNTTFTLPNGQQVPGIIYVQEIQRVFYDNAQLVTQYPLSQTRRFEFTGGFQRVSFDRQVDSLYVVANQVVRQTRGDLPSGSGLNFGTGSAAYVGDYSFFGFTSPVAGGRYRFEAAPYFGSLTYTTALADFRRYLFANPVTLAFRGLHFGRYGSDAESDRLQPLFVGQPYLIRGYDPNSFDVSECQAAPGTTDDCPQFTRLGGSRIAVANVELRIPLFGTEQFGLIPLSFLPTEISPFFDMGYAWNKGDSFELRFDRNTTDRVPVFSAGISARVNILGYAVGEFFWARPFQRPGKNWVFGFQLQPGW